MSNATGVVVTDQLPAGYQYVSDDSASTGTSYVAATGLWTVGSVASGATVSLKITAKGLGTGPYVNTAEVTSAAQPDADSTPGAGTGDHRASVRVPPPAAIDLSLAKTVSDSAPPVGATIVFTVTVSNAAGFSGATGVAVTDRLPAGDRYVSDDSSSTGTN